MFGVDSKLSICCVDMLCTAYTYYFAEMRDVRNLNIK